MRLIARFRSRLALWLAMSLALSSSLILFGGAAQADTVRAFASILPLKHFVDRVGGEHVRVGVMVGPGQSPHTYELSPKQMAALAEAEVYFAIGMPFEDVWLDRIAADNPTLQIVDVRDGVAPQAFEGETATHHHAHPGNHAGHGGAARGDPHIWTDPRRVQIIAKNILDTLRALDPVHDSQYEANFLKFVDELKRLDNDIRLRLEPKKERRFMVFHPAWGYFAKAYGLQQIPIETEGKEPGAKALAQVIDQAKAQGIRVIFVQEQFSRRNAEAVARAIGGRVIAVDPLAENYTENLRLVAETFAEVMK